MMTKRIIINRMTDWYQLTSVNSDPFYVAMTMLEKLASRPKRGVKYNRRNISKKLMEQTNEEVIRTVDKAVTLLLSRELVQLCPSISGEKTLTITEAGNNALKQFKEELANVD